MKGIGILVNSPIRPLINYLLCQLTSLKNYTFQFLTAISKGLSYNFFFS